MLTHTDFLESIRPFIDRLVTIGPEQIHPAAVMIAETIRHGGILHGFATGHSRALTFELAARAGGLVPVNMIAMKDLVLWGDWESTRIMDPRSERSTEPAAALLDLHTVQEEDAFIIGSNSGRNGVIVEMARLARERGHPVIAVTARGSYADAESRHPSGLKLFEVADLVIDTGVPYGDAILTTPHGDRVGGVSSLMHVLIAQSLAVEVTGMLLAGGHGAPIYRSANVPGGDEHNERLLQKYGARIRPIEP